MKKTLTQIIMLLLTFTMQAQQPTFKTISFSNFDINKVQVGTGISKSISNGALTLTIPKSQADKKVAILLDSLYDLSTHAQIYVKSKSEYATFIKAYPSDSQNVTLPDSGYAQRQKIVCASNTQWYTYNYTGDTLANGSPIDAIDEIIIKPDFAIGSEKQIVIVIDSILIGHTGYEPKLPVYETPIGLAWPLNSLAHYYTNGADNAQVVTEGLQLNFSEKNAAKKGINIKVSSGPGDDSYIDMTLNPLLVIKYKGATNDSLRANLKFGPTNSLISNIYFNKINGTGTTTIDFSSLSSLYPFSQISEIQLFLNDYNSSTGTLVLTSLEAGTGMSNENCSGVSIGVFDQQFSNSTSVIFPNPITIGERLSIDSSFETIDFSDLNGLKVAHIKIDSSEVSIPSHLRSGLYILELKNKHTSAYAKIQVK